MRTWSLRNMSLYSSIGAKLSIFQVRLYESAETPSGSLLNIARLGRPVLIICWILKIETLFGLKLYFKMYQRVQYFVRIDPGGCLLCKNKGQNHALQHCVRLECAYCWSSPRCGCPMAR